MVRPVYQNEPESNRARMMVIGAIVCLFPLLVWLRFLPSQGAMRAIRGDVDRLLFRDAAGWQQVDLPGIPCEIQTGPDGELWVATDSPAGLSRWSNGQWVHLGSSFGSSGGLAVSGKQAWVANDTGISRFDGERWHKLPVSIQEPMATAAEGNDVWVINGLGNLAHCVAEVCETHSVTSQIHDDAWGSLRLRDRNRYKYGSRRLGDKTLVRAPGRLWFIHDSAWYSSDGSQWTEWEGARNQRVRSLGYSGGRTWLKTSDSLYAIGDDLQETPFPLDALTGSAVYGVNAGDGHVMMASGGHGFYERAGGIWRAVPIDVSLHAEDVRNVASTPQGAVWITASRLPDLTRVFVLAGIIIAMLVALNVVERRKKSVIFADSAVESRRQV